MRNPVCKVVRFQFSSCSNQNVDLNEHDNIAVQLDLVDPKLLAHIL